MIDFVNMNMDRHIVTMEDPIEYYHKHKKCIVNQREVGTDVPSFGEALRRVLRSDPDVILVGEMRDLETIEAAIRAAETGHLVFATLHTTGAAKTIDRIVDAFPVTQQNQIRVQLSTALICVLSQVLMGRVDTAGMVAGYEFLVVTPAIANLIRDNKTFRIDSMIQTGKEDSACSSSTTTSGSSTPRHDLRRGDDRQEQNPGDLRDKVHRLGRTIGRIEWDEAEEGAT